MHSVAFTRPSCFTNSADDSRDKEIISDGSHIYRVELIIAKL